MKGADIYNLDGVEDVVRLEEVAAKIKRAVVLGGGVIGLQAAQMFHNRGVEVAVIESGQRVLRGVCDAQGAELAARRMREAGVIIRCGAEVKDIIRDKEGGLRGVLLKDKSFLEAGAVAVSGSEDNPALSMVSSTLFGLPLMCMGEVDPEDGAPGYEACVFFDEEKQIYRKLVFKDQRLAGYVLAGDIDCAGVYTSFIKFKIEIDGRIKEKLCAGKPDVLLWPDDFFEKVWNPKNG
ncbi:FAD-dependent oxidoreductase [Desulfovibrio sp. JC010]|uniref:FAD-dependent oxidoreductase n=1 Tax=Desulfovibrio sp. JC010 TaxID=2593641 RepID=UPI0013D740C5|nr:FAD-dependent oxidoreductase [Desulfovibrio sp. JC010]NDV27353.1 hypothetical protein [Desulfovibrio sp. JC010]